MTLENWLKADIESLGGLPRQDNTIPLIAWSPEKYAEIQRNLTSLEQIMEYFSTRVGTQQFYESKLFRALFGSFEAVQTAIFWRTGLYDHSTIQAALLQNASLIRAALRGKDLSFPLLNSQKTLRQISISA